MELFKETGFMYAEPLVIGSLKAMASYPLGFESKLPAKFGLPPLDKPNVAEGIVIKPLKNVVIESKNGPNRVIFKRKVEDFAEVKSRRRGYKQAATSTSGNDQDFELLRDEMFARVTTQRVVNVISKLGRPSSPSQLTKEIESTVRENFKLSETQAETTVPVKEKSGGTAQVRGGVEWKDITKGLIKDVIEEIETEHNELWTSCQRNKKRKGKIMQELWEQCTQCVDEYKKTVVD